MYRECGAGEGPQWEDSRFGDPEQRVWDPDPVRTYSGLGPGTTAPNSSRASYPGEGTVEEPRTEGVKRPETEPHLRKGVRRVRVEECNRRSGDMRTERSESEKTVGFWLTNTYQNIRPSSGPLVP